MGKNHSVIIIANSFQQDYIYDLVTGLSQYIKVILIGSDEHEKYEFGSNVILKNYRGSHDEEVSFYKKALRILRYYFRLFFFLIKSRSPAVHIQWMRFYMIDGVLLTLLARFTGKKAFYTVHDVLPHDEDTALNRFLFKIIYRLQNVLIVHTDFIRQRVINEFHIPESKIHIVKHGVYNVKETEPDSFDSARDKLGMKPDDFVILFFGRLAKYKGLEMLIKIFNRIRKLYTNAKLIVAGKLANDYKEDFEKLLKEYDLNKISFHIRYIEDKEMGLFFTSANITVLPYKEASQSGVLFMSYAHGIPVIAPKLGGFPHDIIPEKTGLLFKPEDEASFENALKKAIEIFSKRDSGKRDFIKEFAQSNYSWEVSCRSLFELYTKSKKYEKH